MSFLIDSKLFASNLRYCRGRKSYTVKELADHADLTPAVNTKAGIRHRRPHRGSTKLYRPCLGGQAGRINTATPA